MAYPTYYPSYPHSTGGYYAPPMPDQLTQLRQSYQQTMPQQPVMQQPISQPQPVMQQPISQPQPVAQNGIIWVPNEMAAREYLVAPNTAVAMWDSGEPVVYLKQADASGKPTLKIYDLVERSLDAQMVQKTKEAPTVEYVTRKEFDELSARLDVLAAKETARPKKVKEEAE